MQVELCDIKVCEKRLDKFEGIKVSIADRNYTLCKACRDSLDKFLGEHLHPGAWSLPKSYIETLDDILGALNPNDLLLGGSPTYPSWVDGLPTNHHGLVIPWSAPGIPYTPPLGTVTGTSTLHPTSLGSQDPPPGYVYGSQSSYTYGSQSMQGYPPELHLGCNTTCNHPIHSSIGYQGAQGSQA